VSAKGEFKKDPGVKFRLAQNLKKYSILSSKRNFCTAPDKQNNFTCTNYFYYKTQKCKNKVTYEKSVPKCQKSKGLNYNRFTCGKPGKDEIVTCWDATKRLMRKCYNVRSNKKYWRCNTMLVSKYNKRKVLWIAYRSFLQKPDDKPFPDW
jgi:hypothetical protein